MRGGLAKRLISVRAAEGIFPVLTTNPLALPAAQDTLLAPRLLPNRARVYPVAGRLSSKVIYDSFLLDGYGPILVPAVISASFGMTTMPSRTK